MNQLGLMRIPAQMLATSIVARSRFAFQEVASR
jgi:hypothetical protein